MGTVPFNAGNTPLTRKSVQGLVVHNSLIVAWAQRGENRRPALGFNVFGGQNVAIIACPTGQNIFPLDCHVKYGSVCQLRRIQPVAKRNRDVDDSIRRSSIGPCKAGIVRDKNVMIASDVTRSSFVRPLTG